MPTRYIAPFDFEKIKDYFIGNDVIFAFVFILIYSCIGAYFGFSNRIYFFLLLIGVVLFGTLFGMSIYILALIFVGVTVFRILADYIR